jgi:hypothetical protein
MPIIIASNVHLLDRAESLRKLLNSGHSAHLFQNDYRPSPKSVTLNFVEAAFPGYTPQTLTGKFAVPSKVKDGEYQTESAAITFACSVDYPLPAYGWYILGGGKVKFSHRFLLPAVMTAGKSIVLRLHGEVWSVSAVKCS